MRVARAAGVSVLLLHAVANHSVDALGLLHKLRHTKTSSSSSKKRDPPPHPTEVENAEKAEKEKQKGLKDPVKFEKYHDGLGELGAVLYAIGCGRKFEPSQELTKAVSGGPQGGAPSSDEEDAPEKALANEGKNAEKQVNDFKEQCRKMNRKRFQSCQTYNCAAEMKNCDKACEGKFNQDNAYCQDHANQLKDLYMNTQAMSKAKHDCVVNHCPNVGGQVLSKVAREDFKDEAAKKAFQAKAAEEPCKGDGKCKEKCKVNELFQCTKAAAKEYGTKSMFQWCVGMFHDWQKTEEVNHETGHPALR